MVISLATFRLEYCRIYTSFYFTRSAEPAEIDWKTAVFILPFARRRDFDGIVQIGILPYLYFLLLLGAMGPERVDWNTAVFILPFTGNRVTFVAFRLEDCRIYTSFYLPTLEELQAIGRLPYYYFLLLLRLTDVSAKDWKIAVLLLPSTAAPASADWNTAVFILSSTKGRKSV